VCRRTQQRATVVKAMKIGEDAPVRMVAACVRIRNATDSSATQAAITTNAKIRNPLTSCARAYARNLSWGVIVIANHAIKIAQPAKQSQIAIALVVTGNPAGSAMYAAPAAIRLIANRRRASPEIQCRTDISQFGESNAFVAEAVGIIPPF